MKTSFKSKIKDMFELGQLKYKVAKRQITFKMVVFWLVLMLPLLIVYYFLCFFVWFQGIVAEVYNELDTYIYTMRKK